MITTSDFLTIILKNILNLLIINNKLEEKGIASRHVFSIYIGTNKRLGRKATLALKTTILDEISENKEKEVSILQFMNQFLSKNEKQSLTNTTNIVEVAISKFSKKTSQVNNKLETVGIYDLVDRGWTLEQYMLKCFDYWDNSSNTGSMPDEHKGFVAQWVDLIKQQPDNRRILLDNGEMIGFWSFTALFNDAFSKAKQGLLLDSEISVAMMPLMFPGTYNIYIASMMLKDNYRKTLALQQLLFSMIETLEEYALKGVFVNEVCAWAYSESGVALSKSLGLKYTLDHTECGQVYCSKAINLLEQPILNDFKTLKALYARHFKKT